MRLQSIKRANNILNKELEMLAILRVHSASAMIKYSKDVEWRTGIWVNNSETCFFIDLIPCHQQVTLIWFPPPASSYLALTTSNQIALLRLIKRPHT